ncbi:carbohydrate ABC transporter permease [Georgenia sp. H159]|uniref:carbohydrate ABC transporter permease n=1 Tax=Georgenia sp. H159 TaxID=3076115 RepID=UPI002D7895F0|nr:carbohydrate ABC transporter permease [Georgenia sp. H159]
MNGLTVRRPATKTLLWVLLVVAVVLYAAPFLYLLLTSFKTPFETLAVPPRVLPSRWTAENYVTALERTGVIASFVNSTTTAIISTLMSLVLATPAAYAITRFRTRSGQLLTMTALITRMVPPVAVGVPMMSIVASMRLTDTPTGLAIAHTTISLPLSILLMASFFEAVPVEIEEAAKMDGCGRLRALWSVVMPVVSGGVAVTAIFAFLASWNEFLFATLLTSVRAQTTPIMIANFQTQFGLDWGPMTALATLYSVPVIVLTMILQRHIVAGLTLGAVKG